jgi:dipeptidyl-peptidase-4
MTGSKKTFLKAKPKGEMTLREMFTRPLIYGTDPGSLKWSPDSKTLAFLWNEEGEPYKDIYVSHFDHPEKLIKLTDCSSIKPLPIEDDERPEEDVDYSEVMQRGVTEFDWLVRDGKTEIVYLCRGNLFRVSVDGGESLRITKSSQGVGQVKITQESRLIGFLMNSNLWAYDTSNGSLSQLTYFSKSHVSVTDYRWSPDSNRAVVGISDTSMFETIKMPDYSPEKEVKINELRRNNAGKPREKVRLGIVSTEGGKTSFIRIPGVQSKEEKKIDTGDEIWIHGMTWTPDGSRLLVTYTGDGKLDWHLFAVEPGKESEPVELFTENVEPWADWAFPASSPDSKYAYYASYESG